MNVTAQSWAGRPAPREFRIPVPSWPFKYREDSSGRDWRLDFLRGWCLFSMVVDHAAANHQTFLFKVTGNGGYPMTGAHGFVFLSGIVFGVVYGKLIASEGWSKALPKALRRGLTLYLVAVALGLFDLLFSLTPWGGGATFTAALNLNTAVSTLTLHGTNDSLMTLYFLFILTAPLALYAMQKGKPWLVVAASAGLWIGHLVLPQHFGNPFDIFVPAAEWQVFFVGGLLVGYHREQLARWFQGGRRQAYLAVLFTLFACLVFLQVAVSIEWRPALVPGTGLDWLSGQVYTEYEHNPPLHVLAIMVAFLALYHLVDWLWAPLRAMFGWFLIPIGGAALYVYIVHTVIVYYVLLHIPFFTQLDGVPLGSVLLALMLGLWLMVRRRVLFQLVPR
jgi:hypothetical protein